MRTRAYRRDVRRRNIHHKKLLDIRRYPGWRGRWYKNDGQYSKGKIHCSCWMCRHKSYAELSMQDKRNLDKLNYEE